MNSKFVSLDRTDYDCHTSADPLPSSGLLAAVIVITLFPRLVNQISARCQRASELTHTRTNSSTRQVASKLHIFLFIYNLHFRIAFSRAAFAFACRLAVETFRAREFPRR